MLVILFIPYLGCSDQSDCIFVGDIPAQASEHPRSEYPKHGINKICPCNEEYVMRYILGEGQCACVKPQKCLRLHPLAFPWLH